MTFNSLSYVTKGQKTQALRYGYAAGQILKIHIEPRRTRRDTKKKMEILQWCSNPKVFPTVLMVLDIAAAVVWFSHGEWRKGVYWLGAAVLTFTVTF